MVPAKKQLNVVFILAFLLFSVIPVQAQEFEMSLLVSEEEQSAIIAHQSNNNLSLQSIKNNPNATDKWWSIVQGNLFDTDDLRPNTSIQNTLDRTFENNQANSNFGFSISTAGDVNGDGYDDVIVGAPYYDNGQSDEGCAYVFYGSAAGLSITPNWMVEGGIDGINFGYSVSKAGDVNNDGYDDIIVSAPSYVQYEAFDGRVYAFYGSASGLSTSPSWIGEPNPSLRGYNLGTSIDAAGDVNGDGYDDIIVGGNDEPGSGAGTVVAYYGSATGLSGISWRLNGPASGSHIGLEVSSAGDVNGDGYDDVVLWNQGWRQFSIQYGSSSGLSTSWEWRTISINSGYRPAIDDADVNGDGYDDVIVGSYPFDGDQVDEGKIDVFHGSSSGLAPTPNLTIEGDQNGAYFGRSVKSIGDLNHDGYEDIIVGANMMDHGETDEGEAFIYFGSSSGLLTSPIWMGESDQVEAQYGYSADSAGDVNGDGYNEIIVSAPYFDNDENDEGRVFLYVNMPPIANAGMDQYVNRNGLVQLNGSTSIDPDSDNPITYEWSQIGGPTVTLSSQFVPNPTFTVSSDPATYTFSLVVKDHLGRPSPQDEILIIVINQNPVADAGLTTAYPPNSMAVLNGAGSYDPDEDYPLSYSWSQTDGPVVSLSDPASANPTFTTPAYTTYLIFSLTVIDDLGLSSSADEVTIYITNKPTANAGDDQSILTLTNVSLNGSGSDPDGDLPLSYHWSQTGGLPVSLSNPNSAQPTFTSPSDPTILSFSLVVTDSLGLDSEPDFISTTVNNRAPVSNAGSDQFVFRSTRVNLSGTSSYDPDGDTPLSYSWTQTGGPLVTLYGSTNKTPFFTAPMDSGTLKFSLIVTDSLGLSSLADEVLITVLGFNVFLPFIIR